MSQCNKRFLRVNGILSNGMWFCSSSCSEAFGKLHSKKEASEVKEVTKKQEEYEKQDLDEEQDVDELLSLEL